MAGPLIPLNSKTSNVVAIVPQNTPLLLMPPDVVNQILLRLPAQQIGESSLVCRQLKQHLENDDVWRILFHSHFRSVNPKFIENFKSAYQNLHFNLTNGVFATLLSLEEHEIVTALAVSGGKVFSGYPDGTIKIWDITKRECLHTFDEHQDMVNAITVSDGKLFSCSDDWTIKIWDMATGKYIATLQGHQDMVNAIAVSDGKLFSCSHDGTIKIWDITTGECTATLKGHTGPVCSIVVFDGKLFCGSSDGTIKIWDITTGKCTTTLKGHKNIVRSIVVSDGKLFSGSDDDTIKIWDITTGECTATLEGHSESVLSIVVFGDKLFSSSYNGIIRVWDITTVKCTARLKGGCKEADNPIVISTGKLICGDGNKIKIRDFIADHNTVFQEIAELLERGDQKLVSQAMHRFSRMPESAKNAIYEKLNRILNLFANDNRSAEDAFYSSNGQSSTPAQRAQAIKDYLNDQPPRNNPLLLAHLGIKTEGDYSKKLKCRSAHLQEIGILSPEDLKLICSISAPFDKLDLLEVVEVEEDFRDNKVKIEADRRKTNLETFLGKICEVVEEKIKEANCSSELLEARRPWVGFQAKLRALQAKFDGIDTARWTVVAFGSKNYNGWANELNALVEELQTLDLDHQVAKLSAYVNQVGIFKAWDDKDTGLRSQGVTCLSALPESARSLQQLLRMGV